MTSSTSVEPLSIAFLLYENRSGSTMLASLLHQRKGLNVLPENNFISRVLYSPISLNTEQDAFKLIDDLFKEKQFQELGVHASLFYEHFKRLSFPIDKKTFIAICLNLLQSELGFSPAKYLIIKSPCYEAIDEIKKTWPSSKFIHIVRDGRAVFNSLQSNMSIYRPQPMNNNVVSAARSWVRKTSATIELKDCITIRYEQLVENEQSALCPVFDFLGLSEQDRATEPSKRSFRDLIGHSQQKLHVNVSKQPNPQRISEWQENLPHSVIGAYDTIAKKALDRLGYPRCEANQFNEKLAIYFVLLQHYSLIPIRTAWLLWETLVATKDLRYRISRRLRRMRS